MPSPTATLASDQRKAIQTGQARANAENFGKSVLETQDNGRDAGYVIYVYNCLNREHIVVQPPLFPAFHIPPCKPDQKFSFTKLPAFVKEPYFKPGSAEMFYKNQDGRKAATSLLNPSALPTTSWENQLAKWEQPDQFGNNLNALGVWWSLTKPEETEKLEDELKTFMDRARRTLQAFVSEAELLAAQDDLKHISPWMHFAMDFFQKQAPWHMSQDHMIKCPNCGDVVKDGIAYHKNSFGEKCIVDMEKYKTLMVAQRRAEQAIEAEMQSEPVTAPAAPAKAKKGKAA